MTEIRGLEDLTFESSTTYTILEEIGRGGQGIVYLAERGALGVSEPVVLKTIRYLRPEHEAQLLREAAIAVRLRHDNIVRTHGLEAIPCSCLPPELVGALDRPATGSIREVRSSRRKKGLLVDRTERRSRGKIRTSVLERDRSDEPKLLFLVMDYVEGTDLKSVIREHAQAGYLIPVPLTAHVMAQIARALAYAHRHIVHRDISPDNVLISEHGVCKLSDFGVASTEAETLQKISGKALYLAPEYYTSGKFDERSDLYSLGVCFYWALTGARPFAVDHKLSFTDQILQVMTQLESGVLSPAEVRRDVPEVLSDIVMRMLAPDPDQRTSRAGDIADEIEQEYLHAKGIGPTHTSLAAYIRFFESGFRESDSDDLNQLLFLRDDLGRFQVQRPMDAAQYTTKAMRVMRRQGLFSNEERSAPQKILRIRCGEGLMESFVAGAGPITLGSDPSNACVLPGLAPFHARLSMQGEAHLLESLGPDAPIRVDSEAVDRAVLDEGDKIRIGAYQAYFFTEKSIDSPDRVVEIGPDHPAPELSAEDLMKRSVALRFPGTPEWTERVGQELTRVLADVQMSDPLRVELEATIQRALLCLSDETPRPLEILVYLVRKKMVLQFRARDDSTGIWDFYRLLKRSATTRDGDAPVRPSIPGFDRMEYRHADRAFRLAVALG